MKVILRCSICGMPVENEKEWCTYGMHKMCWESSQKALKNYIKVLKKRDKFQKRMVIK